MAKNFFGGARGLQRPGLPNILALLQQDPRIEALRKSGGISGPPIPQIPDSLLSPELKAMTARPPGYKDPGGPPPPTPKLPFSMPRELLDRGYVPMAGADPDEVRAQAAEILKFHAKDPAPQPLDAEPGGVIGRQQLIDFLRAKQEGPYATVFGRYMDSREAIPQLSQIMKGSPEEASQAARQLFSAMQRQSGDVRVFGDKMQLPAYANSRDELERYLSRLSPLEAIPQQNPAAGKGAAEDRFAGAFRGPESPAGDAPLGERLNALESKANRESMMRRAEIEGPSMQGFGQLVPPGITGAVQDTIQEYKVRVDDEEGAIRALKREFEDTPEIDEAIASAKFELMRAKAERKQPSAWDFMAMALLNLTGTPPQTSAALVMGLDDQAQREAMLEGRVFGLQDARAQARMGGRRSFHKNQLDQVLAALDAETEAAKEAGRNSRFDREEKFKYDNLKRGLLQGVLGQEAQILGGMAPEAEKQRAAKNRAALKKALGLTDEDLDRAIQQQQQAEIERQRQQDGRQSRMFGTLTGGGFA